MPDEGVPDCWRAEVRGLCSWLGEPGSLVGAFVIVDLAARRPDDHTERTGRHQFRCGYARFAGRAARACSAELGVAPSRAGLTERELDVLRLLAAGRTKAQIAADLVISPSTVHTHTVHIYAKCGVSTRAGLAMFAMRHGLAARTGPAAAKID